MKKTKTNALTKAIITFLGYNGWKVWRQNNIGVYDPKKKVFRKGNNLRGVADIIGFNKDTGQFIAVEVKTGKDKLSSYQKDFLQEVCDSGGWAFVARDFDSFRKNYELRKKRVILNFV